MIKKSDIVVSETVCFEGHEANAKYIELTARINLPTHKVRITLPRTVGDLPIFEHVERLKDKVLKSVGGGSLERFMDILLVRKAEIESIIAQERKAGNISVVDQWECNLGGVQNCIALLMEYQNA